jgi:Uma2 family endonuclease
MAKKLGEYFEAGVHVIWLVDRRKRTVRVHTAVDQSILLKEDQTLDGGAVLPGFVLRLEELFVSDEP